MRRDFAAAAEEARRRRQKLLGTLAEVKQRAAPVQIAEDVLAFVDPSRSILQRLRSGWRGTGCSLLPSWQEQAG